MPVIYQSWDPTITPQMIPQTGPNTCLVPCGVPNTPGCSPSCGSAQMTQIPGVSLNTVPPPATTPVSSGFSLSSIPNWAWIALAGVGGFLLFGHGGKH